MPLGEDWDAFKAKRIEAERPLTMAEKLIKAVPYYGGLSDVRAAAERAVANRKLNNLLHRFVGKAKDK
jgi:hypothetical protein